MVKAFGGMQTIAEKAKLNPTQIYRTLSAVGNPELTSISAILRARGMRPTVEWVKAA
jgi:DNA-binding phage protein